MVSVIKAFCADGYPSLGVPDPCVHVCFDQILVSLSFYYYPIGPDIQAHFRITMRTVKERYLVD